MAFNDIYRNKRILVTGHTGFKGSWLSQWLLNLGANVAGYSLYLPSQPACFEVLGLEKKIKHYEGDVRDGERVASVFSEFLPNIVFHLAAQPIVRTSYDEPKRTFDTNVGGTLNVLEAIRKTSSVEAAVIITSDKCYENVEWEYSYRENDLLGGVDLYSASKACVEVLSRAYYRSLLQNSDHLKGFSTVRAGNVIGGGDWANDRIVPDCIRAWSEKKACQIRQPKSTRPWQHVLEPLSGYLCLGARLIESPEGLTGEAFNFGPAPEVNQTVEDLIVTMSKYWPASQWHIHDVNPTKKEAQLLKLSCEKAYQRLQWRPTLSFEETIEMTSQWYKKYYDDPTEMLALTNAQLSKYMQLAEERNVKWVKS